jgi:hypothetical protein
MRRSDVKTLCTTYLRSAICGVQNLSIGDRYNKMQQAMEDGSADDRCKGTYRLAGMAVFVTVEGNTVNIHADAAKISNTSDEIDQGAGADDMNEYGRNYRKNAKGNFLSAGGKFGLTETVGDASREFSISDMHMTPDAYEKASLGGQANAQQKFHGKKPKQQMLPEYTVTRTMPNASLIFNRADILGMRFTAEGDQLFHVGTGEGLSSTSQFVLAGTPDSNDAAVLMEYATNALETPLYAGAEDFASIGNAIYAAVESDPAAALTQLSATYDEMSAKGLQAKKRKRGNVSNHTGVKSNGNKTKNQEKFENAVEVYKLYVEQFSNFDVPHAFEIDDTFGSKIEEAELDVPKRFGRIVKGWGRFFKDDKRVLASEQNPGNVQLLLDAGYRYKTPVQAAEQRKRKVKLSMDGGQTYVEYNSVADAATALGLRTPSMWNLNKGNRKALYV